MTYILLSQKSAYSCLKRGRFAPPFIPLSNRVDFARKTTLKTKVKSMSISLCKTTSKSKFKNNQNLYTANLSFLLAIFDQGQEHVDFASQNDTNSRPKTVPFFAKKVTQKKCKQKSRKNRLFCFMLLLVFFFAKLA